jgi:hypothetical protein
MLRWGGLDSSDWEQNPVAVSYENSNDCPEDRGKKLLRNIHY